MTSSQNIIANFSLSNYRLSLRSDPIGIATLTGDGTYEYETNATITVKPFPGYVFNNWSGSGIADTNSPTTIVSMISDRNVTANLEKIRYDVHVTVTPVGAGSVSGIGAFGHGETVTLSAIPIQGYEFSHWSGTDFASSVSASQTVTVASHLNLTVTFKRHSDPLLDGDVVGRVSSDSTSQNDAFLRPRGNVDIFFEGREWTKTISLKSGDIHRFGKPLTNNTMIAKDRQISFVALCDDV